MDKNQLFFGDNLEVLRRHVSDESVDLVYLDPPFQSGEDYNVLFEERDGSRAAAQIQAFEDTWRWDMASARAFEEVVERGGEVSRAMQAFRTLLGESDMLAYLSMMAPRLIELHSALKNAGSLYLHCDPTASHYLKMLLDAVFGAENFCSEVIWQRTTNVGSSKARANRFPTNHDTILFYAKNRGEHKFETQYRPYSQEYIDKYYTHDDHDGRGPYQLQALKTVSDERLERLREEDRIVETSGKYLRYKDYLKDKKGVPIDDIWTEIYPVNPMAAEKLGYPTQKPEALMERIIKSSSDEGDVVLDPFCGCGTTIAVAHKLNRRWIGIDITHLAINLIKYRLRDAFGEGVTEEFEVHGEPETKRDAEKLADLDPFEFENWALGLVGARKTDPKRGADRGIDGRLYFHDEREGKDTKQIILSVKSGKTGPKHVRDLRGVVDREDAQIGVLITLQEPTRKMVEEAASGGFYESPWGKHPRIQIITVEQLLDDAQIDYPPARDATYREAPRYVKRVAEQLDLGEEADVDE